METAAGWVVQGCAGAGGPSPNSRFPHDPSRENWGEAAFQTWEGWDLGGWQERES